MSVDLPAKVALFDLDGTLININSITHLIGQWDEFHEASMKCPPHINMVEFAMRMQLCAEVIIVTGKPVEFYQRTVDWLRLHGIMPDSILMRKPLDTRSDAELKIDGIAKHFGVNWKDHILFAVEDRDKMVEAWRAQGITCLQCAPSLY